MTVPKGVMIMISMMNVVIMMNKVMPTMIKILHLAVAIAFALYLMLQLALGWNEKNENDEKFNDGKAEEEQDG